MVQTIEPVELRARLQDGAERILLLDVRQPDEHAFAALGDDVLVPLGELASRVGELADWRDKQVAVYCHHGVRSAQAAAFLVHAGFSDVYNLAGGIDQWSCQIDPSVARY